jgi:hypothetical protein
VDEGRVHCQRRPALERRVVETSQPPGEPVAMTEEERPQRRLLNETCGGVGIAARDRMLDRELRASGVRVPGRCSAVQPGLGPRLTTLELCPQVIAQQVVVAVGRLRPRDLADEQVRACEVPQSLRRVRQPSDGPGQLWLDHVEDRCPREQPDVAVVEDRSQLGPQVFCDVAIPPRHVARLEGGRLTSPMSEGH